MANFEITLEAKQNFVNEANQYLPEGTRYFINDSEDIILAKEN